MTYQVLFSFSLWVLSCFVGRSKDVKKKRRKEVPKSPEKREQDHQEEIHIISSGDDVGSNGMKSMKHFFFLRELFNIFLKQYKYRNFTCMLFPRDDMSGIYCEVFFTCTLVHIYNSSCHAILHIFTYIHMNNISIFNILYVNFYVHYVFHIFAHIHSTS